MIDDELRAIEEKLEKMAPAAMPDDILARMEQAMERWQDHLPEVEKIIPFQAAPVEKSRLKSFNAWATAAAVTLIGAVSLMVYSDEKPDATIASQAPSEPTQLNPITTPVQNIEGAVPAGHAQFQTQVTNTSNSIIKYDAGGRPLRVMQLHFEDEVTVRDRDGKLHKVRQPRVEYYAVPVEIH